MNYNLRLTKYNVISDAIEIPLIKATNESLKGYGYLIDNYENHIDPNDPTNNCLDVAIITAPEKRSKKTIEKLNTVAGRVLNK